MKEEFELINDRDLIDNPTPRLPICLCLDTSGSMDGDPINELNSGIEVFFQAIKEDEVALYSAELAIVTFGNNGVNVVRDFSSLSIDSNLPSLSADGGTPMAEAVNLSLNLLDDRKTQYKDKGVDYYQPWLVLMTDGRPNSVYDLDKPISGVCSLVSMKKLTIFPIGIGKDADMDTLSRFSPDKPPLRLQGLKFKEFFTWLSQSVSRTSQSMPGESVKLDTDGISRWGTI